MRISENRQTLSKMTVTASALCARLLHQVLRYLSALRNLVIVLLVFAFKLLVEQHAFACPCQLSEDDRVPPERMAYSSLFIAVPVALFWMMEVMMREMTWRCLTGCTKQGACSYCGRNTACFFQTLATTALAPLAWLVFVFLDGRYLECAMATVPNHCHVDLQNNSLFLPRSSFSIDLKDPADIHWLSQLIGVSLAGAAFLFYFFVSLVIACCSNTSYHYRRYGDQLAELEEETMATALREYHTENLKAKWKMLMSGGSEEDWVNISAPLSVNPAWQANHKKAFFTPFQECTHDVRMPLEPKRQTSLRSPSPRPQVSLPMDTVTRETVTRDTEDGGSRESRRQLPPLRSNKPPLPQEGPTPPTGQGSQTPAAPVLPPYDATSYQVQYSHHQQQYNPLYADPRLYSVQNQIYPASDAQPLVPYGKDVPTFSQPKNKVKSKKKKVKRSQVLDSGGEYEA